MTQDAFQERFPVSRETLDRLNAYYGLLKAWNARINLVGKTTLDDAWSRHFADSAQLFDLAKGEGRWVDIGSGAGFPGMVIAIMSAEAGLHRVVLVESDQRKASFLRTVARELGLSVKVISRRIEDVEPLCADVLSARALAPLALLLGYAERHLSPDGQALFPKGEKAEAEIADALEQWRFDCEKHPSVTDARASVLSIGDISRV